MIALLATLAWAMPWYASTSEDAAVLSDALARTWPEHGIEIRVGAPVGDAITTEDGALVLRRGEDVVRAAGPMPVELQVVLVRSWLRETEVVVDEVGWVPAPSSPAPLPPPPAPDTAARLFGAVELGTGLRLDGDSGLASGALQLGLRAGTVDGFVRVARSGLESGELDDYGLAITRTAALIGVGWRPAHDAPVTLSAAIGARVSRFQPVWAHVDLVYDLNGDWDETRGTVELGIRYTEPVGPLRLGGGVLVGSNPLALGLGDLAEGWGSFASASLLVETR